MSIQYTYQVISVDQAARCMEIVYSSEGRQTMHIGARLPYEGEVLEDIVKMYAPVNYWTEQELPVVVPQVGVSGVISTAATQEPSQPQSADNQFAAIFPTEATGSIGATTFV
jgi:hypothetical protein